MQNQLQAPGALTRDHADWFSAGTARSEQSQPPVGGSFRWPPRFVRSTCLSNSMTRDANSYDLLRLILALSVIFGHAGALSPQPGYVDPVGWVIGFDYSGGLAVKVFFFLSGLFVTDSMVTGRSASRFVVMRATRLFPGLLVCLVVTSFIVGPVFSELPLADYLRDPLTFSYVAANLTLTDLQWRLPGVFAGSQYGVNGSLWTIPIELRLYFVILLLHLLGAFVRRSSASLAIALAVYFVLTHPDLPFGGREAQVLALCFLAGMAAAIHKRDLPLHGAVALIAWVCALAAWGHVLGQALFYCALFYSMLYIFQWPMLRRARLPGDFSYGVYVYGFVVQQGFADLFPTAHPLVDAVVCMPITAAVAALSWVVVERPALCTARRMFAVSNAARIDARAAWTGVAWAGAVVTAMLLPHTLPLLPGFSPTIAASLDLRIVSYGPVSVAHGVGFNTQPDGASAIWVRLSRAAAPDAEIHLGTKRLVSVVAGDLVTAEVPKRIFAASGSFDLLVVEQVRGRPSASKAVQWQVR